MTNREFAEAVGVSQTMASRMRNGKRAPSVETLNRCISVFKLDPGAAVRVARDAGDWGAYLRDIVFSRTRASAPVARHAVDNQPSGTRKESE